MRALLPTQRRRGRLSRWFLDFPARASVLGFAVLILIGTGLLMLPAASTGASLHAVDALFTATSAACVTGLVVLDTGSDFTVLGQAVILLLIQTGGLGIMTISILFLMVAGGRPGLMERALIHQSFSYQTRLSPVEILRNVVLLTLGFETAGALLLWPVFLGDFPPGEAFYQAGFHAVSAFCNAGFSLFSDSLSGYRGHPLMNLVVCGLIVSGGLGFLVLLEGGRALRRKRRRWERLSLHAKMALATTGLLLAGSVLLVLALEWNHTLAGLSWPDKLMAAVFQAATPRTAGFNTVDIGRLANETLFLFVLLMFVGGSPGSCAGGIKTTTLACLGFLGLSRLRGHQRPRLFRRTLPEGAVWRSLQVGLTSGLVVAAGLMLLLITERGDLPVAESRAQFPELLFEVVSAFGTVGLSTGATPHLSVSGKLVITALMFIGRLGPLVLGMAISRHAAPRAAYAEENVMIG
ncbi:MAG: TrkH family potassium uptake protein [Desulfococcaceae bacterium]